jgi:hypothetical protein
MKRDE